MNPETWASIASAVVVVAGGVWTQKSASRGSRETAVVSHEPAHRAEDRADFESIKQELKDQKAELQREIAQERQHRAEERSRDRRTLDAVMRYLRQTLFVLRTHDIEPPVPDPADASELAGHGIP